MSRNSMNVCHWIFETAPVTIVRSSTSTVISCSGLVDLRLPTKIEKHSDRQPRGDIVESRESTTEQIGSAVPMDRVVASDRRVCIINSEGRLHETIKRLSSKKEDI
ncbi:hypothetical protein CBL_13651 [Carabus blaptoides fortunei]